MHVTSTCASRGGKSRRRGWTGTGAHDAECAFCRSPRAAESTPPAGRRSEPRQHADMMTLRVALHCLRRTPCSRNGPARLSTCRGLPAPCGPKLSREAWWWPSWCTTRRMRGWSSRCCRRSCSCPLPAAAAKTPKRQRRSPTTAPRAGPRETVWAFGRTSLKALPPNRTAPVDRAAAHAARSGACREGLRPQGLSSIVFQRRVRGDRRERAVSP